MSPQQEEEGPFPQFYLYIKTNEGTVRRDIFSEREAFRLTSMLLAWLTRQPFVDPFPAGPTLGFALAGNGDMDTIESIQLYRADSTSDLERLPSVDD